MSKNIVKYFLIAILAMFIGVTLVVVVHAETQMSYEDFELLYLEPVEQPADVKILTFGEEPDSQFFIVWNAVVFDVESSKNNSSLNLGVTLGQKVIWLNIHKALLKTPSYSELESVKKGDKVNFTLSYHKNMKDGESPGSLLRFDNPKVAGKGEERKIGIPYLKLFEAEGGFRSVSIDEFSKLKFDGFKS